MKKYITLAIAISLLSGCQSTEVPQIENNVSDTNIEISNTDKSETTQADLTNPETEELKPDTEETPSDEQTEAIKPADVTIQMEIISQSRDNWRLSDDVFGCYAVTDLDQNGRLELISSYNEGSGLYSYNTFWEINEDCTDLVICESVNQEWTSQADMVVTTTDVYYDGIDYYYIFQDVLRNGYAETYIFNQALTLKNSEIIDTSISTHVILSDVEGNVTEVFKNAGDEEITSEQFEVTINEFFDDCEQTTVTFNWFTSQDVTDWTLQEIDWTNDVVASLIDASYGSFILE